MRAATAMYYYSFNSYLKKRFGTKVRKIGLNAGLECPHRSADGKGCSFCNESGYSEFATTELSLSGQIELSISRMKAKYGSIKFIAYFQNASNTNAPVRELKGIYDVIRPYKDIVGLSISTRPDCVDEEKLDLIAGYLKDYDVWLEYGVQTSHDRTLGRINRGHDFAQAATAIIRTAERGINTGVHVILGLPGESREDIMATAGQLSTLPVNGIKLHVLHVLKGSPMEKDYIEGRVHIMEKDEYALSVCDFLERTRPDIVVLRLAPDVKKGYLIAPTWVDDKSGVIERINSEFRNRGTRQGILC
ncbi:MAG: TIGR01212 family radical SAM protein [Candidatus Omnitrophica bacterium]|nr:TIGR01212 family radical SAM protein [Candidatus Omnitrophota bacterium]MDD5487512.1 TIGR01212 family radical SAM protein [Candidatus Omnitrophota bacterium]